MSSTPAFFIGLVQADGAIDIRKRINGAVEFEEFEKAIKELRVSKRATADGAQPRQRSLIQLVSTWGPG